MEKGLLLKDHIVMEIVDKKKEIQKKNNHIFFCVSLLMLSFVLRTVLVTEVVTQRRVGCEKDVAATRREKMATKIKVSH